MNKLAEILNSSTEFEKIINSAKKSSVIINGLSGTEKRHLAFSVAVKLKRPFVFVAQNDSETENAIIDFELFMGEAPLFFPEEDIFLNERTKSKDISVQRSKIFEKLLAGKTPNLVVNTSILLNKFLKASDYKKRVLTLQMGDKKDTGELISKLVEHGYERTDAIEGVGQFAVRGGILDFYSPNNSAPIRVEFFDDEVDSIRIFDLLSQRTVEQKEQVDIFPVIDNEGNEEVSFLEYLPKEYLVFLEEPQRAIDKINTTIFEYTENIQNSNDNSIKRDIYSKEAILNTLNERKTIFLSTMETRLKDFLNVERYFILGREINGFGNSFESLHNAVTEWQKAQNRIIIFAGTETKAKNLAKELQDKEIAILYTENIERLPNFGSIYITKGNLSCGFEYPEIKTIIVSDRELFGAERSKKSKGQRKTKGLGVNIDELKTGEFIVHNKHGIGIYQGIETLKAGGVIKDYIKIEYAKGDTLYVPINQLESVTKYIGADGRSPHISKMGGQDWAKVKAKVKSGMEDIAEKLVLLYSKREVSKGFAFSEDTVWQKQFEDEFVYEETEDQLRCIEEIKRDMEKVRPMDRLLCGDVGYGKTEVAVRAAFKAVMDGKQVAYLAPTTVLASQHYHSFIKRMKDYPVKIQVLSRLRTPKEQKEILKKVKAGEIDILIGTHRIIQKDVVFKDLGLLIIDEEQKFGVMDKEKIKMMKENVDVLTLTATPIPRTLHMSMVGVKDVSVIYNPPANRNPVQTYVFEYDRGIIREAITRELEREGQVYYLYNRVEDIERVANKIQDDIPWARVVYAHGKMAPNELEDIMLKFSEREYDVLVCTTIIDSGLDIPNVNTIVIENSENLGLSQLYQLRGRVGRSDRIAYAYVTYRKDRILSEIAEKRLKAIREFTEFGSGIKIAMRDLEIRGAGSLIGAEQHGHMEAVGYETYCKLLAETIREIKGEKINDVEDKCMEIELNINAYISEEYIKNEVQRMEMYRKISKILDDEELSDVEDEIIDRFGNMPKETARLFNIVEIKYMARLVDIKSIIEKNDNIIFQFEIKNNINFDTIKETIKRSKGRLMFSSGISPYLTLIKDSDEDEILKNVKFVLQTIIELKKEQQ